VAQRTRRVTLTVARRPRRRRVTLTVAQRPRRRRICERSTGRVCEPGDGRMRVRVGALRYWNQDFLVQSTSPRTHQNQALPCDWVLGVGVRILAEGGQPSGGWRSDGFAPYRQEMLKNRSSIGSLLLAIALWRLHDKDRTGSEFQV